MIARGFSLFFFITRIGSLWLWRFACLNFLYRPTNCSVLVHSTEYGKVRFAVIDNSLISSPFSPVLLVLMSPGFRLKRFIILSIQRSKLNSNSNSNKVKMVKAIKEIHQIMEILVGYSHNHGATSKTMLLRECLKLRSAKKRLMLKKKYSKL